MSQRLGVHIDIRQETDTWPQTHFFLQFLLFPLFPSIKSFPSPSSLYRLQAVIFSIRINDRKKNENQVQSCLLWCVSKVSSLILLLFFQSGIWQTKRDPSFSVMILLKCTQVIHYVIIHLKFRPCFKKEWKAPRQECYNNSLPGILLENQSVHCFAFVSEVSVSLMFTVSTLSKLISSISCFSSFNWEFKMKKEYLWETWWSWSPLLFPSCPPSSSLELKGWQSIFPLNQSDWYIITLNCFL